MNFPKNIRLAALRRFNSSGRGPGIFIQLPMCDLCDKRQHGMEAGGWIEIRCW